ncbi:hypothetical protein V494_05893 [Pseudogymnoascus sp. VKM F-4513 (FW-928)]|nr:hypothetical protein V494_05893 [Pseudogymnoascus sp. VKM F-4513 (FW-928)]
MDTTKEQKAASSPLGESPMILSANDMPPAIPEDTSASGEESSMLPPPVPEPRSRPLSLVTKKNNRLSISFPVQPSETMSPGRQTPTQNSAFPSPITANQPALPSPQDSAGFMVALAGQERKVFELREELNKAEVELKKLKTQWAIHEADKKRAEIRLVRRLEPMQLEDTIQGQATPIGDEEIARRSAELDRRKAILAANATKVSRRKIITGGHTRALSLLSPDRSPNGQYPSFDAVERTRDSIEVGPGLPGVPRKTTIPDTSQGLSRITSDRARHSYQGSTTIGVKQIAEDLKAGLWTFMEDLRQATVGEEALERSAIGGEPSSRFGDEPRTVATGGSKKVNHGPITKKSASRDRGTTTTSKAVPASKAKNTGTQSQPQAQPAHPSTPPPNKTTAMSSSTVDDDWSNWDSPSSKEASPRWSNSTMPSSDDASEAGKPCAVTSELKDSLITDTPPVEEESPWAAFNNFTPVNLKRTASNFIKEFENSLTPPPQSPNNGHDNADTQLSKEKIISDNEARLLLNNLP